MQLVRWIPHHVRCSSGSACCSIAYKALKVSCFAIGFLNASVLIAEGHHTELGLQKVALLAVGVGMEAVCYVSFLRSFSIMDRYLALIAGQEEEEDHSMV